ncbi:MAG: serine/threonine-protein phosphatase [Actinomycetota bacterium]|nr:serine/threonine-protein phosphatase [Actinomycetota bacterium]
MGERRPLGLPLVVLIVVLAVAGALAGVSESVFTHNESRLLKLRVREAGSVLTAGLIDTQTPLASAAELADATNGDVQRFRRLIAADVGPGSGQAFVSVSLWRLAAPNRGPLAVVGVAPKLQTTTYAIPGLFARVAHASKLSVIGLLSAPSRRLGYAYRNPGPTGRFVVYAEKTIPSNRQSKIRRNAAFSELNYALYLGRSERSENLLLSSVNRLPLRGRQASLTVDFGDNALTLAMTPRQPLAGSLPQRLPWIIAVGGVILALSASLMTSRLIQRRRDAEDLAGRLEATASENRRLYAEQRSIARTLQHAMLPDALPQVHGVQTSARYEAGEEGMEIGGDWYDLIPLDDRRLLLVVGDVSGRGLRAATTMASLRYAIHAYAAQNDPPATILTKLSQLVDVSDSGQLATILCALVDIDARSVTVTSAGHLPPLLISGGDAQYVQSAVGLPIGVETQASYSSTTVTATGPATLLAFTDGLVERRGESLDAGLARLRDAARCHDSGLPELLRELVADLRHEPSEDDTAIVGLRWTS